MKNTFFLLLIIAATVSSCSKDAVEPANERFRLKEAQYSEGSSTKYEYDTQGRLSKYTSDGDYSVQHTYNSQGKLIRTEQNRPLEYEYYNEQYTYTANGNLEEMIVRYKNVDYPTEAKYRTSYKYSGERLIESIHYYWVPATGMWTDGSSTKYEYDSDGRLQKYKRDYDYTVYSYDTKGNRNEQKNFMQKSGSSNQYYLERISTYTFDDKKNIYDSLYPNPMKLLGSNPNNYLDNVTKDFNESGATINVSTSTTAYEYNLAGYPVKATYNGKYSTTFILEKY